MMSSEKSPSKDVYFEILRKEQLRHLKRCINSKTNHKTIFFLQGMPGTGKTSLISYMLGASKHFNKKNNISILENIMRSVQSTPTSLLVRLKRQILQNRKLNNLKISSDTSFVNLLTEVRKNFNILIVLDEIDKLTSKKTLKDLELLLELSIKHSNLKTILISNNFRFLQNNISSYCFFENYIDTISFEPFDPSILESIFVDLYLKGKASRTTDKKAKGKGIDSDTLLKIKRLCIRSVTKLNDIRYGFSELEKLLSEKNKKKTAEKRSENDCSKGGQDNEDLILELIEGPVEINDLVLKFREKEKKLRRKGLGIVEIMGKIEKLEMLGKVKVFVEKKKKMVRRV